MLAMFNKSWVKMMRASIDPNGPITLGDAWHVDSESLKIYGLNTLPRKYADLRQQDAPGLVISSCGLIQIGLRYANNGVVDESDVQGLTHRKLYRQLRGRLSLYSRLHEEKQNRIRHNRIAELSSVRTCKYHSPGEN